MHARRPRWALCRAVIAVAALSALALQALLGGLTGPASIDPAHILCLTDIGAESGQPEPSTAHVHLPCCTPAHIPVSAPPPVPDSAIVLWTPHRSVAVIWQPEIVAAPRAPPGISASPRAPPVA